MSESNKSVKPVDFFYDAPFVWLWCVFLCSLTYGLLFRSIFEIYIDPLDPVWEMEQVEMLTVFGFIALYSKIGALISAALSAVVVLLVSLLCMILSTTPNWRLSLPLLCTVTLFPVGIAACVQLMFSMADLPGLAIESNFLIAMLYAAFFGGFWSLAVKDRPLNLTTFNIRNLLGLTTVLSIFTAISLQLEYVWLLAATLLVASNLLAYVILFALQWIGRMIFGIKSQEASRLGDDQRRNQERP